MPEYLRLFGGSTEVDLLGTSANLTQEGWSPAVPAYRNSELGNSSVFEDVYEEITINLNGANALSTLRDLDQLLRMAQKWDKEDPNASPVLLIYRPDNSSLAPGRYYYAPVYGNRGASPIQLPPSFNDLLMVQEVNAVVLRFWRGAFLDTVASSGSSGSISNQTVGSATFSASHHTDSPTAIGISAASGTASSIAPFYTGAVFISDSAFGSQFQILDAESMATGAWTSVADANSRGGAFLRYTPAGAGVGVATAQVTITPFIEADIYALCRVTVASFLLGAQLGHANAVVPTIGLVDYRYNQVVSSIPRLIHLGTYRSENTHNRLRLVAIASTTTGLPTLEIDSVFVVSRSESANIYCIGLDQLYQLGNSGTNPLTAITIKNQPTLTRAPTVGRSPYSTPLGNYENTSFYIGDIGIHTRGDTVQCLPVIAMSNNNFLAPLTFQISVIRDHAYAIPE